MSEPMPIWMFLLACAFSWAGGVFVGRISVRRAPSPRARGVSMDARGLTPEEAIALLHALNVTGGKP